MNGLAIPMPVYIVGKEESLSLNSASNKSAIFYTVAGGDTVGEDLHLT